LDAFGKARIAGGKNMNIVVLVKQVVATTNVKINPETGTLIRDGVESILNPFDDYAVEEALRIREQQGGKVTVITMGPPQSKDILRKTIAMGADEAILVSDRALAGSDTWATAYALAQALKTLGDYDLIITGKQAVDGDTAQVGPEVAAILDLPMVAWVRKIEAVDAKGFRAQRLMEDGYDVLECPLPAVLSVVKEINEPRMESLKGKIRAKQYEPRVMTVADMPGFDTNEVGLKGSPTKVAKTFSPQRVYGGEIISGEPAQAVEHLAEKIKALNIIK
jgi:electron transfer flavoprotein beta subunit